MANTCPGAYLSMINNRFGADPSKGEEAGDGGSDSGQQAHFTTYNETASCDVKAFLFQGNFALQDPGAGCTARGVGTYTGTRACGKHHFQIPAIASAGKSWSFWCIQNPGLAIKGGNASNPILPALRIVKVGTCDTPSSLVVGNPTIVTYASMEAALAGEAAGGHPIPVGTEISCAGRATPLPGCLSAPGDGDG
jgi:hypothetical protein